MQKLQLTIPEPCHENWQNMTPTDQGRFCNACAKEVIDFSMMTDTEVLNYFTTLTHEKVCGRALPSQLERTISKPKDPKKRLFWYWNYIVMFFMFFGKGNSAKAQGAIKPLTQINPVKANDIRGKIATVNVAKHQGNRAITGKVTDVNGNPVSFASVKIKGKPTGISADANGGYSIKANSNVILVISGAGFKEAEVVVGSQSFINTVMEKGGIDIKEVVVRGHRHARHYYDATFVVKDIETGLPISKAKVVIIESGNSNSDIAFTDSEGKFQAKRNKIREIYDVKIVAEGYKSNEFSIEQTDFINIKEEWEVLLKKQKPEIVRSTATPKIGKETTIRLGQVRASKVNGEALYVVDGIIMPVSVDISPDDVEDITVLQAQQAMAIYGTSGAYGAVVITTRKAKEISLKEVVVNSGTMMGGIRNVTIISETTIIERCEKLVDTVKTFVANLTGAIKIYPNPVQHGNEISIALKLKQTGLHQIQITDAAGRIVLQKQINATVKESTEKIIADARWSSGMYYISITDTKNKLINKSSFIVQ